MNEADDREIWESIKGRLDAATLIPKVPPPPTASGLGAKVRWRLGSAPTGPGRKSARALRLGGLAIACAVVGAAIFAGWSGRERQSVGQGAPATDAVHRSIAPAVVATQVGCGPAALGALQDEGFTPYGSRRGGRNSPTLGHAGDVIESIDQITPSRYEVLLPKTLPGQRTLKLIVWLPEAEQLGLVYSSSEVSADTTNSLLHSNRGMALTQRPFAGQDASFVMQSAPRNRWLVQVGPNPAALVWGSEVAPGVRPFELYWADGDREWILIGNPERPEELVDFARSIYC
jgi:hypothetical protein